MAAGPAGLIVTIQHFGASLSSRWLGEIYPATFLVVYKCFLVLGVAFGGHWLADPMVTQHPPGITTPARADLPSGLLNSGTPRGHNQSCNPRIKGL